jgi:uncharacterized protein DUF4365
MQLSGDGGQGRLAVATKKAPKKKAVATKKRRTRAHVIADMSVYHLGYLIARCGFTFEAIEKDYGYDGSIFTYDSQGEIENLNMFTQLKATDKVKLSMDQKHVLFGISKKDMRLWQDEIAPVYLVLFDARNEKAYWVYLQKYFEENGLRASKITTDTVNVELDATRAVDEQAIKGWRDDKSRRLQRIGNIPHA